MIMKYIYSLLLLSFLFCITLNAQLYCCKDSVKYLTAFNCIANDSIIKEKKISVSDSIVDLDRYWFSDELKNYPEEKQILNQYREKNKFKWFAPFYSSCLATLFPDKDKSARNIIFFSKIEDDMLLADLLPHTKQFDRFNYDKMAFQTIGRTYLFIFAKDGNLKAFFSREIHYD